MSSSHGGKRTGRFERGKKLAMGLPENPAPVKFHVSVPDQAVQMIFGLMGTHVQMGAVVFQLESIFQRDRLGRKITVVSPSTRVAALALASFVYDLTHVSMDARSGWMYVDPNEQVHGPYVSSKVRRWREQHYFDANFPLMLNNPVVAIWVPAFMVEALADVLEEHAELSTEFVSMRGDDPCMDWEKTIDEDVAAARRQVHEVHCIALKPGGGEPAGDGQATSGLEYVTESMPMDYDACDFNVFCGVEKSMHVCVVLDTNVLLSHFSFLERRFGDLTCGKSRRGNVLSLILVIPWVVLCELDHLKEGRLRDSALYAIKRIHTLASARDSYVHIQGSASHKQAVEEVELIDGQNQSLRNDDFIMQACVFFQERLVKRMREKKHAAQCVLISNDRGLQLRARSNGIICLKAVEVEATVDAFLEAIGPGTGDDSAECDEGEGNMAAPDSASGKRPADGAKSTEASLSTETASREVENFLLSLQLQSSEPPDRPRADRHPHPPHQRHDPHQSGAREPLQSLHGLAGARPHQEAMEVFHTTTNLSRPVIVDAVQHGLGAFVRYMRQQDLGDLWIDLLEDELKWPGWEASDVLKVLTRHSSTFWGAFDRRLLDEAKTLLRYISPSRFDTHAHECAIIAKKLLNAAYSAFSRPLADSQTEAPDPLTVPGFISLGDAKCAVKESIDALDGRAPR